MLVPNIELLCRLTSKIKEEVKKNDTSNMTIVFEVDENTIEKVDEDFFYRNNLNINEKYVKKTSLNEVNVTIDNIKYKYIIKKEG